MNGISSIREFIIKWDNQYPIDYWFRKKYKIAFNSEAHRNMSFIDMRIEYEEEKLMEQSFKIEERKKEELQDYKLTGKFLKKRNLNPSYSKSELDEAFDNIDIDSINRTNNKTQ